MWQLFAFLSAVFAALVAVFGKIGIKSIDPIVATAVRSIIMATITVLAAIVLHRSTVSPLSSIGVKDWIFIVFAGIAGALSWIFYFLALSSGEASKVSAIDRTSLVFVVVLAAIFLGESMTWKTIIGMVLMVSGAVMMSLI
ncbi:MAG: EamA family transporter [Candidatus Colwellbacteria bacterium]|nr:EamA family transporter [Candidatus Colwellbacteria bacterium]